MPPISGDHPSERRGVIGAHPVEVDAEHEVGHRR